MDQGYPRSGRVVMKRLIFKQGVCGTGIIHPKIKHALFVAMKVYWTVGQLPCIVTSLWDGSHSKKSLHYSGMAADLRTRHVPTAQQKVEIRNILAAELGNEYDVILESIGENNEHIHVEWDDGKYFRDEYVEEILNAK